MKTILVIDDEEVIRKALERYFKKEGYHVHAVSEWETAMGLLRSQRCDLLLVDLMLPNISGIEVTRRLREVQSDLVSIVMTGYGTIPSAVEAIRAGAYHYVTKPFDLEDLGLLVAKALEHAELKEENRRLRHELQEKFGFENIIGEGPALKEIFHMVTKIADTDSTVLITGESGTGKELLARAIHFRSRRSGEAFIAVNCAAIPEGLLESELFGHVKGAFTGAVATRPGKFELANRGTIFLDEIGDMSPALQVKVLRVLQERIVQPVGGHDGREVDIRILAATNQDLEAAIEQKRFRGDLYYRLNVIPIHLPPLRERVEDIEPLVLHFLKKYNESNQKTVSGFSREAMALLAAHPWPGNIRELENLVERLVVVKGTGVIEVSEIEPILRKEPLKRPPEVSIDQVPLPEKGIDLKEAVGRFEAQLIRRALERSGGNKNQAAQLLGLNRTTLIERLKKMERF